ncbi:MAG: hypothetical protein GVY04_20985 [Cyanobacteria bacterium]|nr:hypothetical protein [Cyanobacteria bacterium GSL.Bin1]
MSAIRFYLDEDATSKRILQALRNRGADLLSASEVGMLAQSDEQQLVWALEHQRVIYTFNVRDFYRIHSNWLRSGKSHAGIIFGKQEPSIGDQMRGLSRLASIKSAEEMISNVEFFGRWL